MLIFLVFIGLGIILLYVGSRASETSTRWFLYSFGGFVIIFVLFFIIYTMPSSIMHYYEKALTNKYGAYTKAVIVKREIEDHSYTENETLLQMLHYGIHYEFEYQGRLQKGFFYVYHQECYDKLLVGDDIPIKFLKTKPEKSFPRRIKLCNELQLDRKFCSETIEAT
ncbi:hypothetical protein [Spongiivirga citrea]|uniref:DUF3592 domain-containing protein n=1 Tax=Spongiivirga citrea TaxID=1481457 RepID=A0A6M0CI05_9FLAO|nr:hypothetical protein [Spongiivirga citrea]NER17491.1 hypothetical protein [Spongiivirga citrea]